MKIIIACEFSGIVRDAFIAKGHDVISCDITDTERPGPHLKCDIRDVDLSQYDMMLAFPPCTYLCISGNKWYAKSPQREEALEFFRYLWNVPVGKICIENPVGAAGRYVTSPSQIIQPYDYGHNESKKTCLWLKGIPRLNSTCRTTFNYPVNHRRSPSVFRSRDRSRTYIGIASAMAEQWSVNESAKSFLAASIVSV